MKTENQIKDKINELTKVKGGTYANLRMRTYWIKSLLWVLGFKTIETNFLTKDKALFEWDKQEKLEKLRKLIRQMK
jgi:hypothetical protein